MAREVPMTIAEYHALLRQSGGPKPLTPPQALEPDDRPEAVLLAEMRTLAKANGWQAYDTYHKEDGVLCWLWRTQPKEVLVVQLLSGARAKLTMAQQVRLDTLAETGKVETYDWRPVPKDRAIMRERLSRKEGKEGA
jgi:hypothetical protein